MLVNFIISILLQNIENEYMKFYIDINIKFNILIN